MKPRKSLPSYPDGILAVYDKPRFRDRYTIIYAPYSPNRNSPYPVWPYASSTERGERYYGESDARLTAKECGRLVPWGELPPVVQAVAMHYLPK